MLNEDASLQNHRHSKVFRNKNDLLYVVISPPIRVSWAGYNSLRDLLFFGSWSEQRQYKTQRLFFSLLKRFWQN